ncbi:hypothetical protein ACFLTX_01720 [Chloroflexota bacterium]
MKNNMSSRIQLTLLLTTIALAVQSCGPSPKKAAEIATSTWTATPQLTSTLTTTRTPIPTELPSPTLITFTNTPTLPITTGITTQPERQLLTYEDLMFDFIYSSPVNEEALMFPLNASNSIHTFEGRLELQGEAVNGEGIVLKGDRNQEPEVFHLPEFNFEFVQYGNNLIPAERGIIITEHPYWNYILEPGKTWQESGDQGFSRASFPFALVRKGSNDILNGTMTFLFNDEQISKVWYQITQETTVILWMNMWGLLEADYHPYQILESATIKDSFLSEIANRFPTKPIIELANDYPGVDLTLFSHYVSDVNMTWYGFVINGINYVGGCQTRFGIYPYCESMRVASFSTAKSAFASLAMMRLAQKYDPNLPELLIKDYVPETSYSPGDWNSVTFDNIIDMASGNYGSSGYMVDENRWYNPFWSERYYDKIIEGALSWPHGSAPGTLWVYKTSDTFILTRALQNYLQRKEGPDADIFLFVVDEIFKPLNMGPGVFSTLRTADDNWQGQPYGGFGLWWTPDDLAKINTFLNVDGGIIDDVQILDSKLLSASLQRDPLDRGVYRTIGYGMYNNAFWADSYEYLFGCDVWVPFMIGYSGIVDALFPNETSYYYASDGQEFNFYDPLKVSNKIIPFCQ